MCCKFTKLLICSLFFIEIDDSKNGVYGFDHYGIDKDNNVFFQPEDKWQDPECWLHLKVSQLFDAMDTLEEKYDDVRQDFQNAAAEGRFNDKMFSTVLNKSRRSTGRNLTVLPAGINLGGYSTIRVNDSFIFFHQMKLRENTSLRIKFLHNDLYNTLLTARIGLADLRLIGSYESAIADRNPFSLVYKPIVGNIELLLTGVYYKVEARYRLVQHRLHVEHVTSEIKVKGMLITFFKNGEPEPAVRLEELVIEEYLTRMKIDMDVFIKDYFNNYLMHFNVTEYSKNITELQNYDQEKAMILNEWVDQSVRQLRAKMHLLKVTSVKEPSFNIYSPEGMIFSLKGGVLRGLDSIHRRSVATCKQASGVRHVDAILGFSTLQLEYKYEAMMHIGEWPLSGTLVLNAEDLTAHMSISMVQEPETVDLKFTFYKQARTEYLVIGGAINTKMENFKHLIQNQILSLMTTSVLNTVAGLKYLTKCHSSGVLISHIDRGEIHLRDEVDDHGNVTSSSTNVKDKPVNNKYEITSKIDTNNNKAKKDTTYAIATEVTKITTLSDKDSQHSKKMHVFNGTMDLEAMKQRIRKYVLKF